MSEVTTRTVHFTVAPWMQAYLRMMEVKPAGDYQEITQLDIMDAFKAGWDARGVEVGT